ncbi:MAG TPA: lactonase family protein [Bryobacteraceae bacterium]|nr:lactonase family protein [Bryobacteraceae bacterium]
MTALMDLLLRIRADIAGNWVWAWRVACLLSVAAMFSANSSATQYLVYTGGFNRTGNKGMYAFRFDTKTGKLQRIGLAAEATNPTYFSVHPNGRFLYAVVNMPDSIGGVSSYEIDRKTGNLKLLNTVSSRGTNTCFVAVSHTGKYVLDANYESGSVAAYPVKPDGRLGEASGFSQHQGSSANHERQAGPHAHSFNASPDDRYAIAADLGTDQLFVYHLDGGALAPNNPPFTKVTPGSGPRHFAFHTSGQFAYAVEEIASNLTVFRYDAKGGVLHEIQTISMLPAGFSGTSYAADVQVHPSGKFVYGSNRGNDTIAVFAVQPGSGKLTLIQNAKTEGKTPRIFAIDPTGEFLLAANEGSGSVVVFRIDPASGRLKLTGERADAPGPACVKFAGVLAQ